VHDEWRRLSGSMIGARKICSKRRGEVLTRR
jgi:hypothetical protein